MPGACIETVKLVQGTVFRPPADIGHLAEDRIETTKKGDGLPQHRMLCTRTEELVSWQPDERVLVGRRTRLGERFPRAADQRDSSFAADDKVAVRFSPWPPAEGESIPMLGSMLACRRSFASGRDHERIPR